LRELRRIDEKQPDAARLAAVYGIAISDPRYAALNFFADAGRDLRTIVPSLIGNRLVA